MKERHCDEKGFTMVEVLASTVLIVLILSTFLMMFAQATRTNLASETIVDSTYTAQAEMEKIYGLSKKTAPVNKISVFPPTQYGNSRIVSKDGVSWTEYTKKNPQTDEKILIRLENKNTDAKMTRIVIEVYEGTKVNPSAKMESVLIWEGTAT